MMTPPRDHDCSDGHFFILPGAMSLPKRFSHEVAVAVQVNNWIHL